MKKLTKILVVVLSLIMVVACFAIFAGCNKPVDPDNPDGPDTPDGPQKGDWKNPPKVSTDATVIATFDEAKKALYNEITSKLGTWEGLEAAADAAMAKEIVPFAQDENEENNYLLDQAIMIMGGAEDFGAVPQSEEAVPASWTDALKLIAAMKDADWFGFGGEFGADGHADAKTMFSQGKALFMIEGSWSRWGLGYGDDTCTKLANNTVVIPMPTDVPANWNDSGIAAGAKDNTLVGGVTAGWMISKNAWGANGSSDIAKAAALFVSEMTTNDVLNGWAGGDSFNPVSGSTAQDAAAQKAAGLMQYSCMKMATAEASITAMDARISPENIANLRAKVGSVPTNMSDIVKAGGMANLPYEAPSTLGTAKVADLGAYFNEKTGDNYSHAVTLRVTTQYNKADWQAGLYENALKAFNDKYPAIFVERTDVKIDNAAKELYNRVWADAQNMPDVLAWFSEAQASVIRNDAHLVSVADIQAVYGDYAKNLNTQFFDKYALPVVGTYEGMYVNVAKLAELEIIDAEIYQAYQDAAIAYWGGNYNGGTFPYDQGQY